MADDILIRARLVAEGHADHDAKVTRSASVYEQFARRSSTASRNMARQHETDARRSSGAWTSAAQRAQAATQRFAVQGASGARQAGSAWNAASNQAAGAANRIAGSANAAGAASQRAGNAGRAAGSGFAAGAVGAANLASKCLFLASAAGAAAGALAVLPSLGMALAGMGAVGIGAFSGIGAALKGYAADQNAAAAAAGGGGAAAASNAKAIRDAYKQIANAQRQQARTARSGREQVEAASEAVEAAKKSEARAYRDLQDAIADQARTERDGLESIAAAHKRHLASVKGVQRAEDDLERARQEQARTLADLREQVHDIALTQEGASIAVAEAEIAYDRALRDSEGTELSRRKAAYELAVAKERLRDVERESAETIAENDAAQKAGIDGSERVRDAAERLTESREAEAESERDVARAREDAALANEAADRRVSDSREAADEATEARKRSERDLQRTIRDTAEANEDAARSVQDAMEGLADAQEQAGAAAGGAAGRQSEFAKAMAKLTPEGREFVYQLLRIKEGFKKLGETAQKHMLPGFTQMLKDGEALFPVLERGTERVARVMGEAAKRWGQMFKSEEFQKDLEAGINNSLPIIGTFSEGMRRLVETFVKLSANQELSAAANRLLGVAFEIIIRILEGLNEHADTFAQCLDEWGQLLLWVAGIVPDVAAFLANMGPWALAAAVAIKGLVLAYKGFDILMKIRGWFDDAGKSAQGFYNSANGGGPAGGGGAGGGKGGRHRAPGRGGGGLAGGLIGGAAGLAVGAAISGGDGGDAKGMDAVGEGVANGTNPLWIFDQLKKEVEYAPKAWADIKGWWNDGTTAVKGAMSGAAAAIGADSAGSKAKMTSAWSPLPQQGQTWFGGLRQKAAQFLGLTSTDSGVQSQSAWSRIKGNLSKLPGEAQSHFGGMLNRAKRLLGLTSGDASTQSRATASNINSGLSPLPGHGQTWFGRLRESAGRVAGNLIGDAGSWPGRILRGLGNIATLLFPAGSSILQGLWNGINSGWSWLTGNVSRLARSLLTSAKNALGIASPSRKFRDEVGAWIPEGIGAGVIASARVATDAVRGVATSTLDAYHSGLVGAPLPTAAVLGAGRSGPSTVIEQHFHIAGTVLAERELLQLVQTQTARYTDRNTTSGLVRR